MSDPTYNPKFIARGSYGCVYTPPLRCKDGAHADKYNQEHVSKLMMTSEAIKQRAEFDKLNLKSQDIDPEQQFHIGKPEMCQLGEPMNLENVRGCTNALDPITGMIDYRYNHLLLYKNGGESFGSVLKKFSDLPAREKTDKRKEILIGLLNIFYGVYIMNSKGRYHLDIKPENIVVKDGKFRLIDFGLSVTLTDDYSHNNVFAVNYTLWPYELKLLVQPHDIDKVEFGAAHPGVVMPTKKNSKTLKYLKAMRNNWKKFPTRPNINEKHRTLIRYGLCKADIFALDYVMKRAKRFGVNHDFDTSMLTHPNVGEIKNLNSDTADPVLDIDDGEGIRWTPKKAFTEYREYLRTTFPDSLEKINKYQTLEEKARQQRQRQQRQQRQRQQRQRQQSRKRAADQQARKIAAQLERDPPYPQQQAADQASDTPNIWAEQSAGAPRKLTDYNRFVKQYFGGNPKGSLKEAAKIWRSRK